MNGLVRAVSQLLHQLSSICSLSSSSSLWPSALDKWAVSLQDGEGKGHGGTPTHTPKEADSLPMPQGPYQTCKSIKLEQFPADDHVCVGLPVGVRFCKLLPSEVWVIYQGSAAETWPFWVRLKEVVGGGNELWSGRLETEMFHEVFFFFNTCYSSQCWHAWDARPKHATHV